ncbi:MAG: hypothetical protein ACREJ2_13050, partial [Planctomycetota bacterium]
MNSTPPPQPPAAPQPPPHGGARPGGRGSFQSFWLGGLLALIGAGMVVYGIYSGAPRQVGGTTPTTSIKPVASLPAGAAHDAGPGADGRTGDRAGAPARPTAAMGPGAAAPS